MMSWGRLFRTSLAFVILVVLHFTLRPLLGWRVEMDFLVIALLLAAVRARPAVAAAIGFCLGLVGDALTPEAIGSGALAMTTIGFSASWMKAVFFADNLALNGFFFFLGKWAFDVIYLVSERRLRGTSLLYQLVLWSPLSAAVTALAGIVMLTLLRPLLEPETS